MTVIGEKINGAIPKLAAAIRERDEAYIIESIREQERAGVDYLDICAGTAPEEEYGALCWLIDIAQANSDRPICLDSPDPRMLERVFPRVRKPGILNSISAEGNKCEILLPILRSEPDWQVIALCSGNGGIAAAAEEKAALAFTLIEEAARYGVAPERIHIDPLVLALPAVNDSALQFCDAIRRIKARCPQVRIAAALSNISYGMPARALLNRNFLTMAMCAGLDTVICNPCDREIAGNLYATQALLGRDRHCRKYNSAFRSGQIGPRPAK